MRGLLLLVLLPGLAIGQECKIQGECLGNSLDLDSFDSERECLAHCNTVKDCEWYTYDSGDGFCNSLQDCTEIDSTCTTCTSGENECQLPLMCFVPGECHGIFLDHIDVATAEECLKRCHNDYPQCNYFSFLTDDLICNLFESCSLDGNQTQVVSGERDCHGSGSDADINKLSSSQIMFSEVTLTIDLGGQTKIFLQYYNGAEWIHMPSFHGNGTATNCSAPPNYPISNYGSEAQVINGSITVCGGYNSVTTQCFSLDPSLNIWVEFPKMNVGRGFAASVMTPDGWWITGGGGTTASMFTSSIFNGYSWTEGPHLPSPRYLHCLTQINETHFFIAGGYDGSIPHFSDAYLLDWAAKMWIELPDMPNEKAGHTCGLYHDSTLGPLVITAGGYTSTPTSVEALNLATLEWIAFPDLPTSSGYGKFFNDDGDIILVSGHYNGNIFRFNPGNWTFSIIPGQNLPMTGQGVAIAAVTDDQLFGCN